MRVHGVSVRDFRCYERSEAVFGDGLTVISGPNGAGKTNLVEALYFGCTGRSCRTSNDRELVRFGAGAARVVVYAEAEDGRHELTVGFAPGDTKQMRVDGAAVARMLDVAARPLVSVFLPDRLELIKGPPSLRRAHLDQVVAALWPVRTATRRAYSQALAQRNALISRIRAGRGSRSSLATWDAQLARLGLMLMSDRRQALDPIAAAFPAVCEQLQLGGAPTVAYRPRSKAESEGELAAELAERVETDLDRGFTGHGPHRDELVLAREGRELRTYGSQGQQRIALLALLLAEREAIGRMRSGPPLILLDDVMSELDGSRRLALVALLRRDGGQAVITTTDLDHVPGGDREDVTRIAVRSGTVLRDVLAAAG